MSGHFQFAESNAEALELYLLEALDPAERAQVEGHLASTCPECAAELPRARARLAAFAFTAPAEQPDPALKRRVLAGVQPKAEVPPPRTRAHHLGWSWSWGPAAIALGLLCLILLGRVAGLAARGRNTEAQLATAQRQTLAALAQNRDLRFAASVVADPGTVMVPVQATPHTPEGRVYLNSARGAVIAASHLPPAPAGHIYEMWLLPAHGNPVPAGLFQTSAAGEAVHAQPGALHDIAGVAVSLEPAAGSAQPTGPIVLAAKLP